MEAPGGLETALVGAFAAQALAVAVVNPRQVREFTNACAARANRPKWP